MSNTDQEKIPKASVEEYHEVFGGRLPRDLRFAEENKAPEIRRMAIEIKSNEVDMNLSEIAEELGVSVATLSKAALGRAGIRAGEDGLSTTERIYLGLRQMKESFTDEQ